MNILLVSYFYPPYLVGPTIRIRSFFEYLNENNINAHLLAVNSDCYPIKVIDKDVFNKRIARTPILFGRRFIKVSDKKENNNKSFLVKIAKIIRPLLIPDEYVLWLPYALRTGSKLCKNKKIDIVFSTAPPFTNHVVSYLLARFNNIKLIVDYRDLWNGNRFYERNKLYFIKNIEKFIEKKIISYSNKVIVTTDPAREKVQEIFKVYKAHVVTNGYENKIDKKDIQYPFKTNRNKLKIYYTGTLSKYRNPEYLFKALTESEYKNKIELNFIGYIDPKFKDVFESYKKYLFLNTVDNLNHNSVIEILKKDADVLLLLQRNEEGGDTAIPGKLYEYLSLRKPILCLDDDGGAVTKFLKKYNINTINYYYINEIKNEIERIFTNYERIVNNFILPESIVEKYYRGHSNKLLYELMSDIFYTDKRQ